MNELGPDKIKFVAQSKLNKEEKEDNGNIFGRVKENRTQIIQTEFFKKAAITQKSNHFEISVYAKILERTHLEGIENLTKILSVGNIKATYYEVLQTFITFLEYFSHCFETQLKQTIHNPSFFLVRSQKKVHWEDYNITLNNIKITDCTKKLSRIKFERMRLRFNGLIWFIRNPNSNFIEVTLNYPILKCVFVYSRQSYPKNCFSFLAYWFLNLKPNEQLLLFSLVDICEKPNYTLIEHDISHFFTNLLKFLIKLKNNDIVIKMDEELARLPILITLMSKEFSELITNDCLLPPIQIASILNECHESDIIAQIFSWLRITSNEKGELKVSSQDQKEEGASISAQTKYIKTYAEKKGLGHIDRWETEVTSARNWLKQTKLLSIPKTESLLEYRKVYVLVYHSSRFSRDRENGPVFLYNLGQQNIFLVSCSENISSENQIEEWFEAINVAANESDLISERVKQGYSEKKRLGGNYSSSGIKQGLLKRKWIEKDGEESQSLVKIPISEPTELGEKVKEIILIFLTKNHSDACLKFLKRLHNIDKLDYEDDWDLPVVNGKLKQKQIVKLLKIWKPSEQWTLNLIENLVNTKQED